MSTRKPCASVLHGLGSGSPRRTGQSGGGCSEYVYVCVCLHTHAFSGVSDCLLEICMLDMPGVSRGSRQPTEAPLSRGEELLWAHCCSTRALRAWPGGRRKERPAQTGTRDTETLPGGSQLKGQEAELGPGPHCVCVHLVRWVPGVFPKPLDGCLYFPS